MSGLSPDSVLLSRVPFESFSTSVLHEALTSCPVDARSDLSALVFAVSESTVQHYINAVATRMGDQRDQYLNSSAVKNPRYGGVSVKAFEAALDNVVELYGLPELHEYRISSD